MHGATEKLIRFAWDCDLLLYDAQYTEEEYAQKKGFGHSTVSQAKIVAKACGAKKLILIHYDPTHTDAILKEREQLCQVSYARQGERYKL